MNYPTLLSVAIAQNTDDSENFNDEKGKYYKPHIKCQVSSSTHFFT